MNIEKVIVANFTEDDESFPAKKRITNAKERLEFVNAVLDCITKLKNSGHFKAYKNLIIDRELKDLDLGLRHELNEKEFYRKQGAAVTLEAFFDLDITWNIYTTEKTVLIERLKQLET